MDIEEKFYEAYKISELRDLHAKEDLVFSCSKNDFEAYYNFVVAPVKRSLCGGDSVLTYHGIELRVFDIDEPKIILR